MPKEKEEKEEKPIEYYRDSTPDPTRYDMWYVKSRTGYGMAEKELDQLIRDGMRVKPIEQWMLDKEWEEVAVRDRRTNRLLDICKVVNAYVDKK
jgi:hypothetical protein